MNTTLDLFDPPPPFQRGSDTSRAAAAQAAPQASTRRARVLAYIAGMGAHGATMDEIAHRLRMPIQSVCPRLAELRELDRVCDSSNRRHTRSGRLAVVWVAA